MEKMAFFEGSSKVCGVGGWMDPWEWVDLGGWMHDGQRCRELTGRQTDRQTSESNLGARGCMLFAL